MENRVLNAIPEENKQSLLTYFLGLPLVWFGWINENPDVIMAWCTLFGTGVLGIRFSIDIYRFWKDR